MVKDKRRNSEKRKEKSRDAARCRRGKEMEVFTELSQGLPLPEHVSTQLDKASVMRLAISVLKIHKLLHAGTEESKKLSSPSEEAKGEGQHKVDRVDQLYQKALEGFAFILSQDGDIVYLTESVARYLGLQQVELMGQSMYEFTHPCDHDELREMFSASTKGGTKGDQDPLRTLFLRIKCTLTSKGRNVNLKSASYKVMKCCGRLMTCKGLGVSNPSSKSQQFLVGVAEPLPHPSNIEVPLDSQTFVSKHSMDLHFIFCDDRIQELAGYSTDFMQDQSLFSFHHALDSELVEKAYKDLFSKGQTMTGAYRFLARHGGYMWVVTQATVIHNTRTQKPQSVVCVHYVLSGIEEEDQVVSHVQCTAPGTALTPSTSAASTPKSLPEEMGSPAVLEKSGGKVLVGSLLPPKVELSTENIFSPRSKEDKGYLVPVELKGTVTYRHEEPKDLASLAPNAGDESVPLLTFGQDNSRPLLKQEPPSGPATPDMAYRKDASPAPLPTVASNTSSRLSSPTDYLNMAMPGDVDAMDQFFQTISTGDKMEAELADIDFELRAPYIPMDGEEDLGLLPPSPYHLFNLTPDVNPGLFGRTEDVFGPKQSDFTESSPPLKRSVRDMIGGSTAVASIEQPPDIMYLQLKRPLDMNSLEKGPPKVKVSRLGAGATSEAPLPLPAPAAPNMAGPESSKASVLLNLLTRGEDRLYGYKVSPMCAKPAGGASLPPLKRQKSELFSSLTHHDCEVNAPTASTHLLQGRELLQALDGGLTNPARVNLS